MKFRILEQRGEYRIEAFVENANEQKTSETITVEGRGWFKPAEVVKTQHYHKFGEWRRVFITNGEPRLVDDMGREIFGSNPLGLEFVTHGLPGFVESPDNKEAKFDSYEEAENYIWQEWGNQGWKAIEKPEWRQV